MSSNLSNEDSIGWADNLTQEDEILSHLTSLHEMTAAGKITWELISYSPPFFFIRNPFVEDKEATISHRLLVEGETMDGRTFHYQIREVINVPSGLSDIEIDEKKPHTGYEMALSFDGQYEYLTSQKEVLNTYKSHPVTLFAQAVVERLSSANFQYLIREPDQTFSAEPLPAELEKLPIVQRIQGLFDNCDALAFHALVLSDGLRNGLGLKD